MRRFLTLIALVAIAGGVLSGCGTAQRKNAEKALAALAATAHTPRKYTYTEIEPSGQVTTVNGVVEDDLRHKERLFLGTEVAADQVVSDDALAMRIPSDRALARLVNRTPASPAAAPAASGAPSVAGTGTTTDALNALKQQRWVIDPAGAPPLVRPSTIGPGGRERDPVTGDDPLLDAVDTFEYARRAIASALTVIQFNPDDINYKPSEDPFQKPPVGGPVIRYDLIRPSLPNAALQAGAGRSNLPGPEHFRKMAIYVRGGRVEKIEEQTYPADRLKATIDRGVAFLKKAGASPAILAQARALKKLPKQEASVAIVAALNVLRERNGDVPIKLRKLTMKITDLGSKNLRVLLPPDAVHASLDILKNRGHSAGVADKGSGSPQTNPGAAPTSLPADTSPATTVAAATAPWSRGRFS